MPPAGSRLSGSVRRSSRLLPVRPLSQGLLPYPHRGSVPAPCWAHWPLCCLPDHRPLFRRRLNRQLPAASARFPLVPAANRGCFLPVSGFLYGLCLAFLSSACYRLRSCLPLPSRNPQKCCPRFSSFLLPRPPRTWRFAGPDTPPTQSAQPSTHCPRHFAGFLPPARQLFAAPHTVPRNFLWQLSQRHRLPALAPSCRRANFRSFSHLVKARVLPPTVHLPSRSGLNIPEPHHTAPPGSPRQTPAASVAALSVGLLPRLSSGSLPHWLAGKPPAVAYCLKVAAVQPDSGYSQKQGLFPVPHWLAGKLPAAAQCPKAAAVQRCSRYYQKRQGP